MFTQKISMKCTSHQFEEELKKELTKIGYEVRGYKGNEICPYVVNNYNGEHGTIGSAVETRQYKEGRTYYGEFNAPLFLALAAMTDLEGGGYGEYWTFTYTGEVNSGSWSVGKPYKALHSVHDSEAFQDDRGHTSGFSSSPFTYIRRATKEELVQYFTNTKEKEEIVMKKETFKVTRVGMEKIFGVACSTWKPKIEEIVLEHQKSPFDKEIILPREVVEEMFDAATEDQLPILKKEIPGYENDKNLFIERFNQTDLAATSIAATSKLLFGNSSLQIARGAAIDIGRSDLDGRAFYVDDMVSVTLHQTTGGGTVIELKRK